MNPLVNWHQVQLDRLADRLRKTAHESPAGRDIPFGLSGLFIGRQNAANVTMEATAAWRDQALERWSTEAAQIVGVAA